MEPIILPVNHFAQSISGGVGSIGSRMKNVQKNKKRIDSITAM
jgi:hypothetical protein